MSCVQRTCRVYQHGVSLIELMIGLVVGAVILFGIIETMLVSKSASQTQQGLSAIAENARFTFEFMNRDLRMAGFEWPVGGEDFNLVDGSGDPVLDGDGNPVVVAGVQYIDFTESGTTQKVSAYYKNSDGDDVQIEYSFEDDGANGKVIKYKHSEITGSVSETLIDGIESVDFEFGVWDLDTSSSPSVSTLRYYKGDDFGDIGVMNETHRIVSFRVTLSFNDRVTEGNGLDMENNLRTISSTIALRNPIIAAKNKMNE